MKFYKPQAEIIRILFKQKGFSGIPLSLVETNLQEVFDKIVELGREIPTTVIADLHTTVLIREYNHGKNGASRSVTLKGVSAGIVSGLFNEKYLQNK